MSKKFKRLSAVILAVVMMLGSTVMASAATMHIYIREWEQGTSSNTYLGTPKPISGITNPVVTVTGVDSNGTYKDALELARSKKQLNVLWNKEADEYLTTLSVPGYSKTNDGKNINPTYDSAGNMIHATWQGSSWMWYPGNNVDLENTSSYPQTTLGGTKVPSANEFSIVLSYDTTHFDW
jgi:hypothetical protein